MGKEIGNEFYLIENFHSKEDFARYTNPSCLKDKKHKFEWFEVQKEGLSKLPVFAIKGRMFFDNFQSKSLPIEFKSEKQRKLGCSFCWKTEEDVIWKEEKIYLYGKSLELCKDCYEFFFEGKEKYFCSVCHSPFIPRFEFINKCYECWKVSQIEPSKKFLIEKTFSKNRQFLINDTLEIQDKRKSFVEWIQKTTTENLHLTEMYVCEDSEEGSLHSNYVIPQYFKEWKNCNTQKKLNSEICIEIDNLPFEQAREVICVIALRLIQEKQTFFIFYAEGQRSPHIRIYNLSFLEDLTEVQRVQAITLFLKKVSGELFRYLDRSVFQDSHFLPLPYSLHWKYHTPYLCYGGFQNE